MASDLEVVGKFQFEHEAHVARLALEAEGIDAAIMADNAGGMLPMLQLLFPVRVLVHRDNAARAREILADRRPARGEDAETAEDAEATDEEP
jgi:hypothetical protein